MGIIQTYDYQEQIDDLAKASGLSKQAIRRVLQLQRQLVQDKLRLGFSINLKGIVRIEPKERGDDVVLSALVAQSVVRPVTIKRVGGDSVLSEIEKNMVDIEELT